MKALVPQGLTGSPNYFGLLNNFMTLIICESLREIGEMACVTPVWSSRGQTLKTMAALLSCLFSSHFNSTCDFSARFPGKNKFSPLSSCTRDIKSHLR